MRAFDRDLICGGHYGQRPVCRANRPNTWLHRPACKREENPCQLGAVHTWHLSDEVSRAEHVRSARVQQRPVCYCLCSEAREALTVKRRDFITLLGGAT